MLLNFTHDATGYNPMIHFHDVKALSYEMGTRKQKYATCSCIVMKHDAWPNDAVYLPGYIFLKWTSQWDLSTHAISKFLHLVNKLSKQQFINIWHLLLVALYE